MAVVKKEEWFTASLPILKEKGVDGITIEALCESVNRTKGSFYHHFKDFTHYTQGLLEWWYDTYTVAIIADVDKEPTPASKMAKLEKYSASVDLQAEVAIRGWAHFDKRAAVIMKKVDEARNQFLADIYKEFIKDEALAENLAAIDYAAFIGFLLMDYNLFKTDSNEYRKYTHLYSEAVLVLVKRKNQFREGVNIEELRKLFIS